MKITIEITIETHENNPPSLEVRTVESPDSEEMKHSLWLPRTSKEMF